MLRKSLNVRSIIIIAIYAILIITNCLGDNSDVCPIRYYGRPVITREYEVLENDSIDQIISDDRYVYVLYGGNSGNVQVFGMDGSYQYSAYFYGHLNGAFSIAVENGVLYVKDCQHNLYQLRDGEFISFTERTEAEELRKQIDFSQQSDHFRVKLGSVYRIDGDQEAFIKRPFVSALQQDGVWWVATVFIVALIGYFRFGRRNQRIPDQKL